MRAKLSSLLVLLALVAGGVLSAGAAMGRSGQVQDRPRESGPPRTPAPREPGPPDSAPRQGRIVPPPRAAADPPPACDLNGDNRGDFVVGVPGEHGTDIAGAGAIDVSYLLEDGSLLHDDIHGPQVFGAGFGSSVACGDFDGDGNDDVAVGSPDRSERRGNVHVLFGDPNGLGGQQPLNEQFLSQNTIGELAQPYDRFGYALAAGDFDGDGFDDLAIGSPGEGVEDDDSPKHPLGIVHILRGSQGGVQAAQTLHAFPAPVALTARFGHALAVGDVNDDGRDDLAIGAPEYGPVGRVFVMRGRSEPEPIDDETSFTLLNPVELSGEPFHGEYSTESKFGAAVAFGDVDGSGADDLIVGSPLRNHGDDLNVGEVHVFRSDGAKIDASAYQVHGEGSFGVPGDPGPNDQFGFSVAAGDLDLDGRDDVIIGGLEWDPALGDACCRGSVFALTSSGGPIRLDGIGLPELEFGWSVASWQPLAGEGARILVGVPGAPVNGVLRAGEVEVFEWSGEDLVQIATMNQAAPSWSYGEQPEPGFSDDTYWGVQEGERFGTSLAG